MTREKAKFDPSAIPGLRPASRLARPARETLRRKRIFRDNFRRRLAESGLSIEEVAERSGIDLPALKRWRRDGVAQPKHAHIENLAAIFGLSDPWSLMEDLSPAARATVDRATNPSVEEVRQEQPKLFEQFATEDWDELFSSHGHGGPLTHEGVIETAHRINAKRELRRKFEAVLETDHFATLAKLIEVLYRDTTPH